MSELSATHEISPFMAILWCFYPIGILVFFELLMGSQDDDDDDQGGISRNVMYHILFTSVVALYIVSGVGNIAFA